MWIWLVSSIAGSLLGAATTEWFKDTTAGKWCFDKYLDIAYWANERYGFDILDKEEISWKIKNPNINQKIITLEQRIAELEKKNNAN